ncbi:hypothetical protein sscle_03g027340 [Sclerotinia sclerotiorum 1980 UF-70]|uniref:Uncharacterized protein n=2 Tax=Sclerotinia sclerotiorum (strain ATCC 18683 / 1980 / Ss-1) TaxID=665079 RepID=A0A1D9PZ40_SCLS1|nr:hypothetical protein sscle_03g027340 [Sclerotinia sclerotiorum 1980 UF-70]
MADRKHVRRSRSQGYFHRRRPDDIYIQNPHEFTFPYSNTEEMPTPGLLFDDEGKENIHFRGLDIEASSPRNFFLEKPPANWKSEQSPISPGVTVLLTPAYGDVDGDLDVMEFFQAAAYPGPRAVRITADRPRDIQRSANVDKKKRPSKVGLPSPKTPKAWPSIVEPDISTLPSQEEVERNVLEARHKLVGQKTSGYIRRPRLDNPLEAYLVAPGPMSNRKQTRSPSPEINYPKRCPERGQSRSPAVDDRKRFLEPQHSLLQNRQQKRVLSNEAKVLRSTRSEKSMRDPTSAINGTIPRTPSPVFDFDDSEITDIESGTEDDERGNERLSRCETLSSQDPHSPMFDSPPKPLEKDWKFRLQQDCATGTLGALQSPSMSSSASQTPRKLPKSTNKRLGEIGIPNYSAMYSNDYTMGTHTTRPRQISAEISVRSPISPNVPPPRRRSPPIMAPIHRDQSEARGATFEPESRTPRTLVTNWLTSMSSNAGRKEQPREHDVFWKRSWGRKTKPKMEGWI